MEIAFIKPFTFQQHLANWNELELTVKLYKEVGHRNADFLFDWLLYAWENLYLSCIDPKYLHSVTLVKAKIAILDTLIDDKADNPKTRFEYLEELFKFFHKEDIKWEILMEKEKMHLEVTIKVWEEILAEVKTYPRFEEFREVFHWDVIQIINSMHWAYLANKYPLFNNLLENRTYGHHSMTVIACGMLDLMCSPTFDKSDFPATRKILFLAQQLARLGNMVNTYPREMTENDISSEILTMAIERGIISASNLTEDFKNLEKILKVHDIMPEFDAYWNDLFNLMKEFGKNIKSFDMNQLLEERKFIKKIYDERVRYWEEAYRDKRFVQSE